jgi:hypothetical protein
MNFLLTHQTDQKTTGFLEINHHSELKNSRTNTLLFAAKNKPLKIQQNETDWFVLGDPVLPKAKQGDPKSFFESFFRHFTPNSIRHLEGHYYIIKISKRKNKVAVFTGFLNILPIYFYAETNQAIITSKLIWLKQIIPSVGLNKRYVLDKLLFNYPLFRTTSMKGARALQANEYIELDAGIPNIETHIEWHQLFEPDRNCWKTSKQTLSDIFADKIEAAFINKDIWISLTGGLDSRVLLAAAMAYKVQPNLYSYGDWMSPDVQLASSLANSVQIPYQPIIIDNAYAKNRFWLDGKEVVEHTDGLMNFSRAHYKYLLETVPQSGKAIMTGIFGSEMLRSMTLTGNLMTTAITALFEKTDLDTYAAFIKSHPFIKTLNLNQFTIELDELIKDLWVYKAGIQKDLTLNQKFYHFVYGEVFRKFFGPEIMLELAEFPVRTPFLSYEFLEALNRSPYSGANANYMEKNPVRRMIGQKLYPELILKFKRELAYYPLDRHYRPIDLSSTLGLLRIVAGYAYKKVFANHTYKHPNYSRLCFADNIEAFKGIEFNTLYFDQTQIQSLLNNGQWEKNIIHFSNLMSTMHWLKHAGLND